MKRQLPAWLALTIIALAAGLLLSLTNALTKERIAEQSAIAANAARQAVLPAADTFEELELKENTFGVDNCYVGKAGDAIVGYTSQITVKGYGGAIEVVTGVDAAGVVTGIGVGGASFSETPGLGAKTKEAKFTDQFKGITPPAVLKENIDSVSGASISSGAVVSGVNKAASYIYLKELGFGQEETEAPLTGDIRTISVQGFGSAFDVTIGVDEAGAITGLQIGGDTFAETPGLGERALEKSFRDQFIGKTYPVAFGDGVDALTGATVTSKAVLDGVNTLLGGESAQIEAPAATEEPTPEPIPTATPQAPAAEPEPTEAPVAEPAAAASDIKTVVETVKGFGGDIEVTVGINPDNTIASVAVGGANFAETAGLGARTQEEAFTSQFIGASAPVAFGNGIDAIAGATVSSTAVLDAVNKALGAEEAPEPIEAPTAEPVAAASDIKTVVETVKGFGGDIEVTVGINPDNTIASVAVGGANFAETAGLGARTQEEAFTSQFIGASAPVAFGNGIDAIAGATVSSTAVLDAVNKALAQ